MKAISDLNDKLAAYLVIAQNELIECIFDLDSSTSLEDVADRKLAIFTCLDDLCDHMEDSFRTMEDEVRQQARLHPKKKDYNFALKMAVVRLMDNYLRRINDEDKNSIALFGIIHLLTDALRWPIEVLDKKGKEVTDSIRAEVSQISDQQWLQLGLANLAFSSMVDKALEESRIRNTYGKILDF